MSPHKHRLLECLCAKVETRPPFHIHLPEQNIGAPPELSTILLRRVRPPRRSVCGVSAIIATKGAIEADDQRPRLSRFLRSVEVSRWAGVGARTAKS